MRQTYVLMRLKRPVPTLKHLKEDDTEPLPPLDELRRQIESNWPNIQWIRSALGRIETQDIQADVALGVWETNYSFMVHVQAGARVQASLLDLAETHGWVVGEVSTQEILRSAEPK